MESTRLPLNKIQGNILFGFNKPFQNFLFLSFRSADAARKWIGEINRNHITTSNAEAVRTFNEQFKAERAKGGSAPASHWAHLAFSYRGLQFVSVRQEEEQKAFSAAFKDGMASRSDILGDTGRNAPDKWVEPFRNQDAPIHAVLIVAADDKDVLEKLRTSVCGTAAFEAAVKSYKNLPGRARADAPGHEHFGFKDGISQPRVRTRWGDSADIEPGEGLLWPGEFVLGYPTQIGRDKPGRAGANPDPGPPSNGGPEWARGGSFMVFRRLEQDVRRFREQVKEQAARNDMTGPEFEANIVGRSKSGDLFEGCPAAAHIRKAYPRDVAATQNVRDMASEIETHRLMRRGIPYGPSYNPDDLATDDQSRGLLFVAYQSSIESQYEFVQQKWINFRRFPTMPVNPGEDPIAATSPAGPFQLKPDHPEVQLNHDVKMTGGEYFFSPSIDALTYLATGPA